MRLAAFIRGHIEPISVEWEQFAATLLPEEELSSSVLRNSIAELLTEIAADMDEDQTAEEQQQKSAIRIAPTSPRVRWCSTRWRGFRWDCPPDNSSPNSGRSALRSSGCGSVALSRSTVLRWRK